MKTLNYTHFISAVGAVVIFTLTALPVHAASVQCTNLQQNLYQGLSDSNTNGEVTLLQNYLAAIGYLSATPNGHFGPATLIAVEGFQAANTISVVGQVGPVTRAAIQKLSCVASTGTVTTSTTNTSTTNSTVTATISPQTGSVLMTGEKMTLTWSAQPGVRYNVMLESQYGAGYGFIASNLQVGQYTWTAGNVSPNQGPTTVVGPGTYRIHIENAATGITTSDQMSGLFTIAPVPLVINYIVPPSVPADGKTSVVLYGAGFNSSTQLLLDLYQTLYPTYVSSDGTALIFTIPTNAYLGVHSVEAMNSYTTSTSTIAATSTPVNITATAPTQ